MLTVNGRSRSDRRWVVRVMAPGILFCFFGAFLSAFLFRHHGSCFLLLTFPTAAVDRIQISDFFLPRELHAPRSQRLVPSLRSLNSSHVKDLRSLIFDCNSRA